MRGLFAGYHFIKVKHGSTVAQSCFPDGLLDHVLHHMRLFRGETTIATIPIQGEISKELSDMGLHNTLKPLLGGGLYNADIALHARKVLAINDFLEIGSSGVSPFCTEQEMAIQKILQFLQSVSILHLNTEASASRTELLWT